MNFKEYLVEVGNSIIKPKKLEIEKKGEETFYKYDINDSAYVTHITTKERPKKIALEILFYDDSVHAFDRWDKTNKGNALEVVGNTVWCIDNHIKTFSPDTQVFSMHFDGKEEEKGDMRRRDIYLKFVERYLKKNNIKNYEINKTGKVVRVTFKDVHVKDFK